MPNYCFVHYRKELTNEQIEKLKEKLSYDGVLSYRSVKDCEDDLIISIAINDKIKYAYSKFINDNVFNLTLEEKKAFLNNENYEIFRYGRLVNKDYIVRNFYRKDYPKDKLLDVWYSYNIREYGVKWDMCSPYIESDGLRFSSPWTQPNDEILEGIANKFREVLEKDEDIEVEIEYEGEDEVDIVYY